MKQSLPRPDFDADSRKQSSRRRHGFTLIECTIVIGLITTIGMAATKILATLITVGNQYQVTFAEAGILHRLERTFRQDVHLSDQMNVSPDGSQIQLSSTNLTETRIIRYQFVSNGIQREIGSVEAPTARDVFVIEKLTGRFHVQADTVELQLTSPTSQSIKASLGLLNRHRMKSSTNREETRP